MKNYQINRAIILNWYYIKRDPLYYNIEYYLFKPMQLFVMLPIIDTQHMTCFENFTRIMDVKSMIIDQSCVTAGLYTAKFYG